jgi:PLP dependent protein
LQSSTAHHVADLADVVQTVSGAHAARRLAGRAAQAGKVLDVLIEVDLVGDRTGVSPEQLPSFVGDVSGLEGLRLRGLMTLPPIPRAAEDSRAWFAQLRDLRDRVRDKRPEVLELSMGMSLDYAIAVEEGATIVRIGTALFGPRTPLERK